jgi:hypothetical protein
VERRDHRFAEGFDAWVQIVRRGSAVTLGVPNSLMSPPAEKPLPPPARMTAFIVGSFFARSRAVSKARRREIEKLFTGGLHKVMMARPSFTA